MSVLLGNMWRVSVLGVVLSLVVLFSDAGGQAPKQSTAHVPVVEDLVQLLQVRSDLRTALEGAIRTADVKGLRDLDSFLIYLDGLVTFVPTEHELPTGLKFRYIVDQAPGDQLNRDKSFSAWMKKLAEAWGQFLDTPASASGIPSFVARPNFNIGDYFVGPSGWLTFNQFFARELKPGKRPIAEPCNDRVIVSPPTPHSQASGTSTRTRRSRSRVSAGRSLSYWTAARTRTRSRTASTRIASWVLTTTTVTTCPSPVRSRKYATSMAEFTWT